MFLKKTTFILSLIDLYRQTIAQETLGLGGHEIYRFW